MHVVQYHKDKESASIMDDGIYTAVFRHNIGNWFSIPMQELPIGIVNTGDTCFAGALLQCLSTVTMPENVLESSCDALDQLVASVHAKQVTCNTAVMYMETPLIREIYDADMEIKVNSVQCNSFLPRVKRAVLSPNPSIQI